MQEMEREKNRNGRLQGGCKREIEIQRDRLREKERESQKEG